MNVLTLEQGIRKGEGSQDRAHKTERKYFDFVVSGKSIGTLVDAKRYDMIGAFGWAKNKEYELERINEFLGQQKPELESGRSCFYVCAECGDFWCGAITAKIEFSDTEVTWKDFAYEHPNLEPAFRPLEEIGSFTFDKTEYVRVFDALKNQITP
jgi:hypothetical protein